MNPLLLTDSYKLTHWKQYPPDTEKVFSYFESRGGEFKETTFFGLQYFLKKYLEGQFVTQDNIDEAARVAERHLGDPTLFNRAGWEYILENHGGKLPVRINAVEEGTSVPVSNALMTIENTDPEVPWLTNWLETLLVQVWYPTTVATLSREMKRMIKDYLVQTGGLDGLDFKLHDFGFRGVSSVESAGIGGAAHLVNFKGTDTLAALVAAINYYDAYDMPGFSIPASEHSTMTAWGKGHEKDAYENMLDQYPTGLVACVSDSYDIYNACKNIWGKDLKDKVLSRQGTLVVRPDSGHPPDVVCKVLDTLGKAFGFTKNKQGYKVLPPEVRVIQGDGIDYSMPNMILLNMKWAGWSAENVAFGMGGALLQKLNRDTQMFAFKCSNVTRSGEEQDVSKSPVGAEWKASKAGRLALTRCNGIFKTKRVGDIAPEDEILMRTVFLDGELVDPITFEEVRENAEKGL